MWSFFKKNLNLARNKSKRAYRWPQRNEYDIFDMCIIWTIYSRYDSRNLRISILRRFHSMDSIVLEDVSHKNAIVKSWKRGRCRIIEHFFWENKKRINNFDRFLADWIQAKIASQTKNQMLIDKIVGLFLFE